MMIMVATIGNETEDPCCYVFQTGEIGITTYIDDQCVFRHYVLTHLSLFI